MQARSRLLFGRVRSWPSGFFGQSSRRTEVCKSCEGMTFTDSGGTESQTPQGAFSVPASPFCNHHERKN